MTWAHVCLRLVVVTAIAGGAATAGASSLTEAFESAVARNADITALIARLPESSLRRQATTALLPGGWSLTVTAEGDQPTTGRGGREVGAEAGFPIWLPGERGATAAVADRTFAALDADIGRKRLDVAKVVRDAYWEVHEAREKLSLAERRVGIARTFAVDTKRRAAAGQVAQVDVHIAEAERSDAEAAVAGRRSDLAEAVIHFDGKTGRQPPRTFAEQPATRTDRHPNVRALEAAVAKAEAERHLVGVVDRDRPELGLTTNTNRGDREEAYNTQLGARVTIPFAYDAVNAPKRAAADAAVIAARAELEAATRSIQHDVDKARAKLAGASQQLAALDRRYAQLSAAVVLIERAQQGGQTSLSELIRARVQMFEAANARALARIAVQRARSDINQALGIEP